MRNIWVTMSRLYRQSPVLNAMIFASILCMLLLSLRIAHNGDFTYLFLAWNLFLAWIPLISAFIAYELDRKLVGQIRLLLMICAGVWFVFLPNAPYMLTDLIHLRPSNSIAFWFDLTLFVALALTGLLSCLISQYWMQQIVKKIAGSTVSWVFVLGISAFSSFGIYLGRFLHWNSWAVVSNPTGLLTGVWESVRHPILHFQTFAFSGIFTLFLIAAYVMLVVLTHLQPDNRQ